MTSSSHGSCSPTDDDEDAAVRRRFEWNETSPSTAVVQTVAEADGRDPTAVTPLYERVDPDSLDVLIASSRDGTDPVDVTVSLTFSGFLVTVHGTGEVAVHRGHGTGRSDG